MIPKHNTQKLLPRKLLAEVTALLDTPEILLLTGARQVGKTSILYLIIEALKRKGVRDNAIYFFDLEDLPTLDIFNSGAMEFYLFQTGCMSLNWAGLPLKAHLMSFGKKGIYISSI